MNSFRNYLADPDSSVEALRAGVSFCVEVMSARSDSQKCLAFRFRAAVSSDAKVLRLELDDQPTANTLVNRN